MISSKKKNSQKELPATPFSGKKGQRNLMVAVVLAIAVTNAVFIVLPTDEIRGMYGNLAAPATAGAAMVIGGLVVAKQGVKGLFGRAYLALTIRIVLWGIAEVIWAYNTVVLNIEVPFPSAADALWLAGYAPLGFYMFTMSSSVYGVNARKKATLVVSLAVAAFSGLYIATLISASQLMGDDSAEMITITILYPVLDAIIVVPAVVSIVKSGRGELTAIPWVFISWMLTVVADSIFGYAIVTEASAELQMVSDIVYNSAYLFMAGGIFWHYRHFVVGPKKLERGIAKDEEVA